MGCPAKKVTAGACGSALMREPALAASLVAAVRAAVPAAVPVTVKHRAGWDECSQNAPEFARALVDAGAAMITVHGRTRAQGFSGFGAHAADRGGARRAATVGAGDRQRRRQGRRRLPAHEGRDRLRRRDDRARRHGQPLAVPVAGRARARATRSGTAVAGRAAARLAAARRSRRRAQPGEDADPRAAQDAGLVFARAARRRAAAPADVHLERPGGAAGHGRGVLRRPRRDDGGSAGRDAARRSDRQVDRAQRRRGGPIAWEDGAA